MLAVGSLLSPSVFARGNTIRHYLAVGLDDANANTDVIAVVSYDTALHHVTVTQIPRDTYCAFGGGQNKLNQLYPHALAERDTRAAGEEAMSLLTRELSGLLGINFDGYIAVTIRAFSKVIDRIGGIRISIPKDIEYVDAEGGEATILSKGEHLLDGETAAHFVRYRVGYKTGDLGRIDAQKLFISALLSRVGEGFSPAMLTSVFGAMRDGMVTNIPLSRAIGLAIAFMRHYGESDIRYLTLPGEACYVNGVSYYVLAKREVEDAVCRFMLGGTGQGTTIDPEGRFVSRESRIRGIYNREYREYRVWTDSELQNINRDKN